MENRQEVLGEEHADILMSMSSLISIFRGPKRRKEVENLSVQVVEMGKGVPGAENPDTLRILPQLAR